MKKSITLLLVLATLNIFSFSSTAAEVKLTTEQKQVLYNCGYPALKGKNNSH